MKDDLPNGDMNNDYESLLTNIRANCARTVQTCLPHARQHKFITLLAGGPSLNDFTAEIARKCSRGQPLITVNGTYNWALEHGLKPQGQIIVDSRPNNVRFVRPVISKCRYLLASQCDPAVFDAVPPEQTWMWHNNGSNDLLRELHALNAGKKWAPINGGRTVTLRAISLLEMLGWSKMDIYGFDSCLRGDDHHAYEQSENDNEQLIPFTVRRRTFRCTPWMVGQAQEFLLMMSHMKQRVTLNVYGNGLIAELLKTRLVEEKDECG